MTNTRIYDGSLACGKCEKCPVVELIEGGAMVRIYDPDRPDRGVFTMSTEEYNALLRDARPVTL